MKVFRVKLGKETLTKSMWMTFPLKEKKKQLV